MSGLFADKLIDMDMGKVCDREGLLWPHRIT